MLYAYIGEASKDYAEVIIQRHKSVVVTGIYADGTRELSVIVKNGNDRMVDAWSRALERGVL